MDLTESIAPRSDQMNADDLIGGPITVTIADVRGGNEEQPVNYHLAEFPRPFRPSKTVRRILVAAWGLNSDDHIGKRMTLYRDASVKWAGKEVGGIRVSALSGIAKPMNLALTETRGKRTQHRVDVLPDNAPTSAPVDEATVARLADLRAEWEDATPERREEIKAEVAELSP